MTTLEVSGLSSEQLCQSIVPGAAGFGNINFVNQPIAQIQLGTFTNGRVSPGGYVAVNLRSSLIMCQLLSFGNRGIITENNNPVVGQRPTPSSPATLPEGYVSFPEDHAAYKIHDEYLTWTVARDRCVSEGARLAVTDSVDKIMHITSLQNISRYNSLHVGIYWSTVNKWVRADTGYPLTSIPWDENFRFGNGRCAQIVVWFDRLQNFNCGKEDAFVCEIPISAD